MYQGDGEFDMFLSLLMMLKPTAESLGNCLIPALFCKTEMRILSLSFFGRDEILTIGIPWHSSSRENEEKVAHRQPFGDVFLDEEVHE